MNSFIVLKLSEVQGWIYTRGCAKGFGEWLSKNEYMILLTCCVVMFMQVSRRETEAQKLISDQLALLICVYAIEFKVNLPIV